MKHPLNRSNVGHALAVGTENKTMYVPVIFLLMPIKHHHLLMAHTGRIGHPLAVRTENQRIYL